MDYSGEPATLPGLERDAETFRAEASHIRRQLRFGGDAVVDASVPRMSASDPKGDYWWSWLSGGEPSPSSPAPGSPRRFRMVDLFAGCGGLSAGSGLLLAESGLRPVTELAADTDSAALRVYEANHRVNLTTTEPVEDLVRFSVGASRGGAVFDGAPELADMAAQEACAGVDLVVAGPPCQGHSNLNNRSRRDDPRNRLLLAAPAFAVAANAESLIVENVPQAVHDRGRSVQMACELLLSSGYQLDCGVLNAADMGWPQRRRRFFLVARRGGPPFSLAAVATALSDRRSRPITWGLDGPGMPAGGPPCPTMDEPANLSGENYERVRWMFDRGEYDLPLSERPRSHRNGTSYTAVYGRMSPDEPAPTITTGFGCPGKGRFVHPLEPRTLTPREAARLQGFRSGYRFSADGKPPSRTAVSRWIGNAVPMPLAYAAALSALGPGLAASTSQAATVRSGG